MSDCIFNFINYLFPPSFIAILVILLFKREVSKRHSNNPAVKSFIVGFFKEEVIYRKHKKAKSKKSRQQGEAQSVD